MSASSFRAVHPTRIPQSQKRWEGGGSASPEHPLPTMTKPRPGKTVCLIYAGKNFVLGENSDKTSPKLEKKMPDGQRLFGYHAEDRALQLAQRAGGKIKKVVVLRWTKKGKLSMAKPCRHCERSLLEAGVRHRQIHYSNWDGKIVAWEE